MRLRTINAFLNLFLLCLVVETVDSGLHSMTKLYFSTVFRRGYVKDWWHIRMISQFMDRK